jgi:hypothetical protein
MKRLDLLESLVGSLTAEVESRRDGNAKHHEDAAAAKELKALRSENAKLREDASAGISALTEENSRLKQTLAEEQTFKEEMLKRVDTMLLRFQNIAQGKQ